MVRFRRGVAGRQQPLSGPSPVADFTKYRAAEDNDDYRHRMIVNAATLLFLAALIGSGLWLVETMAQMQKDQACVLSGRRGCTPVDVDIKAR